ncbi:MAG: alpha/beta fold hydrolase [Comamonadaceae bacterium]|nr:MAG: alpha/beta fold hydrolase [Comamonadaceae bacterium]
MLARLQKLITIGLTGGATLWLVLYWHKSPVIAVAGFFVLTGAYIVFLGIEFILLWLLHGDDPAPRAGIRELLRAWVGESKVAPQVFCWRQPFRSGAVPDELAPAPAGAAHRRGVVFIHGFFCNRGFWTPWLEQVKRRGAESGSGHAFVAVNLEPVFGSIDDYAVQIDEAVTTVTAATGLPPLLVCHSMGGLAARAWLRAFQGEARIFHVVTIGTPHRGTWLARFGQGTNGRQMRLGGDWHAQLDLGMAPGRHALFTCWYSNCDNIVFPPSTATLPGADNRLVTGAAHVEMAFLPEVMNTTLALLDPRMC